MSKNERIERLEIILGTLIGSLWAAGKLDQPTKEELHELIECEKVKDAPHAVAAQ